MKKIVYSFMTARSAAGIFLALTTAFVTYPIGYGLGEKIGHPVLIGVSVAILLFLAIDHTLGNIAPEAWKRVFEKKLDAVTFSILTIFFVLLAATSISSIWANRVLSEFMFVAPTDHKEQIEEQNTTLDNTLAIFKDQVETAKSDLEEVKKTERAKVKALTNHRDDATRRQLEKVAFENNTDVWVYENMPVRIRSIKKALRNQSKAIKKAEVKLLAAQQQLSTETSEKSAATLKILNTYASIDAAKFEDHSKTKSSFNKYMIYADVSAGGLVLFLSILIAMILVKEKIEIPERKSALVLVSLVSVKVGNYILGRFEKWFNLDLDGNGIVGKVGKHLDPTRTVTDSAALDLDTARRFSLLDSKISALEQENLELRKRPVSDKPKKIKEIKTKTPGASRLKGLKDEIESIQNEKGFENLSKASQKMLSKYAKELLSKGTITTASKGLLNSRAALAKSSSPETRDRNLIKSNWLSKIVAIKDGKIV